jgi:hypothetical protein
LCSESEYIKDIQSSGFSIAVSLLAVQTEHISDARMAGGSEMNTGLFYL